MESLKSNICVHEEKQRNTGENNAKLCFFPILNFRYRKTNLAKFKNHNSGGRKEEKA